MQQLNILRIFLSIYVGMCTHIVVIHPASRPPIHSGNLPRGENPIHKPANKKSTTETHCPSYHRCSPQFASLRGVRYARSLEKAAHVDDDGAMI